MEMSTALRCAALLVSLGMAGPSIGAEPAQKISIGLSSSSIPAAAPRIANEMGLFAKHGLEARIVPMDNGSVATMALISGSIDVTASGPTDVVIGKARGQDLVAVATLYGGFSAVLVLSKDAADKSGILSTAPVAARLKALDGLVIGSTSATSTFTMALKASTEAVGVKVRLTYMAQPAMIAALETGAIQGFLASAPYYGVPLARGSGVLWISGPKGEFPQRFTPANAATLNTTRAFATAHPDLIQRAVAVFADLGQAVRVRPAEVKSAIARLFPDVDRATLDLMFENESLGFRPSPLSVEDMEREIAFVKLSGIRLPDPDGPDPRVLLYP